MPSVDQFCRELSGLILLILLLLVCLTFQDYGITNDEEVQNVYGIKLLSYYLTFGEDRSAFTYLDLFRYGGLFDLIAAVLNLISPFGEYETRHLLGGLCGIAGGIGALRVGRLVGGARAGLLALLLLILTPAYYGHSFNNPKDAPFAAAMIWCLYYLCKIVVTLPLPPWRLVLKLGVAFGIALGIRVGAILVIPYLGLAAILYLFVQWRSGLPARMVGRQAGQAFLRLLPGLPVAYAIMAFFWPWAILKPLNPWIALRDFSNLPINLDTLVDGTWVKATRLPRDYLPDYLLVNLPEIVLAGLAIMVVSNLIGIVGRLQQPGRQMLCRWQDSDRRHLQVFLIGLAAFFPVGFFVLTVPTAYNGIRHFLFILPPMAVLAALGLELVWRRAAALGATVQRGYIWLLAVALVGHIWIMVQLHPDEYVYYNQLTGGVKGAAGAYELDYWGNSLLEATQSLASYIQLENGDKPLTRKYKVAVCGHRLSSAYYFPEFLEYTRVVDESDFLISFTQANCHRQFEGKQIIAVERFGVALSVVKDRRYLNNGASRPAQP